MMKQPVEECRGKNLVSEQITPVRKAGIGSQKNRPVFVASSDQLEEGMSLLLRELGIAHFVDNQQTGGNVASQALAQQAGMGSAFQGLCKVCQRRKHHGMA